MKRDMDLVRELLLKVEEAQEPTSNDLLPESATDSDYERVTEHLRMLIDDAEFMTGIPAHVMAGKNWLDLKLTWAGHAFLDSVRDPEVWATTKKGAMASYGRNWVMGPIRRRVDRRPR